MEQDQPTYSLRDFLTVIFKHKHKIWTVFFATAITVSYATYKSPSVYEAKTSLIVKFGRSNIYRPEVGETNKIFSSDPKKIINTEIEILTSRDLMENAVNIIGIDKIYPDLLDRPRGNITPLESAVDRFSKNTSVGVVRDSDVIDISFEHNNPNIAARAANLLVELFKEKHIKVFGGPETSFFKEQLKVYEKKWMAAENELKVFKEKNKIFSFDEQKSLWLKQRTEMDMSLKSTQNRIRELEQKIVSLEIQKESVPEKIPLESGNRTNRYQIIDEAKSNLLTLKRKEQELIGKYKNFDAGNQLLTSLREEIKLVEEFLQNQEKELKEDVSMGKNATYQKLEMELITTRAELSSLGAKIENMELQKSQLNSDLAALDLSKQEYSILLSKLATNEKSYETFLRKSEEANMAKEMDRMKMDNISVIQEAVVPSKPIKPNRRLNVIMGVLLGAFSGIGLAFFSEYMGQGLATPEAVERRLGLPIIATISFKR